jgi:hypothetical protein
VVEQVEQQLLVAVQVLVDFADFWGERIVGQRWNWEGKV